MAEKIKKFFAKKKIEAKFKLAGPGHKLAEASGGPQKPTKAAAPPQIKPSTQTEAKRQAAEAALLRLNSQRKECAFNSLSAIQAQVRREVEAEKRENSNKPPQAEHKVVETHLESSPLLAVSGVFYRCPIISDAEILSKDEWKVKVKEFLYEQLEEERGLTACLIIHSCNYNRIKVKECVDVLVRYIDNIIANPEEIKFHKIRCQNATFNDKVLPVLGATEFLFAAGFRNAEIEHNGNLEQFWVYNESNIDGLDTLQFLRESLKSEDRIELELDRNLKVLSPSLAAKKVELPLAFYAMSADELKREQHTRSEDLERLTQLRTKAMREKEELREIRKYKFALMRIRFPDGIYLQGTFSVYEKFSEVLSFIRDNLEVPSAPFQLNTPTGHRLEPADGETSLLDLRLVPATILTFQWESEVTPDVTSTSLKDEIMILMESL